MKRTFARYLRMKPQALDNIILERDVTALELYIASVIVTGTKQGCYARLGALLDRTIGRVSSEPVFVDEKLASTLTPEELAALKKVVNG